MSVNVVLNGVTYAIPESGDEAWGDAVSDYLVAQATGLLQKSGGTFTLTAEVDFGATYGLKSAYFKSRTASAASAGQLRLANADTIKWRNAANDADLTLGVSSDGLQFGGVDLPISGAIVNADIADDAAISLSKLAATTASRALVSDGDGFIVPATTTATEIGYVNGVTSAIQTQLNDKASTGSVSTVAGDLSTHIADTTTHGVSTALLGADDYAQVGNKDLNPNTVFFTNGGSVRFTPAGSGATTLIAGGTGTINLTLPAATGTVATLAGTEAFTNKDIDGGTASNARRITLPKDTLANLQALNRKEGTVVYATDQAKPYYDTGSVLTPVGSGSGGGGINYAEGDNTDFETGVGDWTAFASSAVPTTLTGGSPTLTATRTTSSPLRGTGSLLLTDGTQYDGASLLYTQDRADFASMQEVEFDFEPSAAIDEGDWEVWIEDVTNGEMIQPVPYQLPSCSGTEKFRCVWQSSADGTSYRVGIRQAVASPGNLKIDNFRIGPQSLAPLGAAIVEGDYSSNFSPVGFGTVTNKKIIGNRVGKYLHIQGAFTAGTPSGVTAKLSLSGISIDPEFLPSVATQAVGEIERVGSSAVSDLAIFYDGADTTAIYITDNSASSGLFAGRNGDQVSNGNDTFSFNVRLPILGWSSNVQMSDSSSQSVVAARYANSLGLSITNGGNYILDFATRSYDTHALAGNAGAGVVSADGGATQASGFKLSAPSAGKYKIFAAIRYATGTFTEGNTIALYLYKNGSSSYISRYIQTIPFTGSSGHSVNFFDEIDLAAGDYIQIGAGHDESTARTLATSATINYVTFEKIQGPSSIAASEKIIATYLTTETTNIANGGTAILGVTSTKVVDTHGAVAAGVFTAPRAGFVTVGAGAIFDHATYAAIANLRVQVNGTTKYTAGNTHPETSTTGCVLPVHITSPKIPVVAGDLVRIQLEQENSTMAARALTGGNSNGQVNGQYISFEMD